MADVTLDNSAATWGAWASSLTNYTTLSTACAAVGTGETIWVANAHDETLASSTILAIPAGKMTSVDPSDGSFLAGAKIKNSSSANATLRNTSGAIVYAGINFADPSVSGRVIWSSNGLGYKSILKNCTVNRGTSTGTLAPIFGAVDGDWVICTDCTFDANGGTRLYFGIPGNESVVEFNNITFTNCTNVADFLIGGSADRTKIFIRCTDLSGFTNIFDTQSSGMFATLQSCKLSSTSYSTPVGGTVTQAASITFINCSADAVEATQARRKIIKADNFVDYDSTTYHTESSDGETNYSLKFTTASSLDNSRAIDSGQLAIWHDASASKTLTIEIGSSVTLTNADCFAEAIWNNEANGDGTGTASSVGVFESTEVAPGYVTPSALTTSSNTWDAGTIAYPYKIEISGIYPREPGYVYVTVFLTKHLGSGNYLWVDPAITLT